MGVEMHECDGCHDIRRVMFFPELEGESGALVVARPGAWLCFDCYRRLVTPTIYAALHPDDD